MTHWKLRLAASLVTLAVVLQPGHAHAASAVAVPAATTQMEHISVQAIGKGSPVILIPGLSSPRAVWDGVAPTLAKSHRVYLVQVNGFGGDDPRANLKPGILDGIVADLNTLVTREKLAQPAIVGHSMGGLVALMMAKAHPDHVGKLMIVDSLPFFGALFGPTATVDQLRPQAAAMRDAIVRTSGDKAAQAASGEKVASQMTLKPDAHAKVVGWAGNADPRVSGEAMYEDLTTDLRPAMASIATPITLVYPWNASLPKTMAEGLYKREYASAPNVTFVDIPDAAHFAMLDQPAAFQAALTRFVGN